MIAAATMTRVNHLLSAGTTYQGARRVAVFGSLLHTRPYNPSSECVPRRRRRENFQFLSALSISSGNDVPVPCTGTRLIVTCVVALPKGVTHDKLYRRICI